MPTINKKATKAHWIPEAKPHDRRKHSEPRYNTRRWRKARSTYLKHNPQCIQCKRLSSVVDHIKPVRLGGEFWQPNNWQPLCEPCHARKSGQEAHL